jgi:phage baseplate assembly protein W
MAITPITKKRILYSDFGRDMAKHPLTDDLVRNTNENAVKQSLRNLVLTDKFERPFQPNIGCGVRAMLFDNANQHNIALAKESILSVIKAHEPRVRIIKVDIQPILNSEGNTLNSRGTISRPNIGDDNAVVITIDFYLINSSEPTSVDIILNRIR